MGLKERIDIENVDGQIFEIKVVDPENSKLASFTHYLRNHKSGVSQFYKKNALSHVKKILEQEYPTNQITNIFAEETLQYLIFDLKKSVPLIRDNFGIRKLTPRECFSFQGYPQNYILLNLADSKLYTQAS